MSKQNLAKLLQAAADDEQLVEQMKNTASFDEFKSLARQRGFDLGNICQEDVKRAIDVATGAVEEEELSEDELEMVSGGNSHALPNFEPSFIDVPKNRGKLFEFYEGWPVK